MSGVEKGMGQLMERDKFSVGGESLYFIDGCVFYILTVLDRIWGLQKSASWFSPPFAYHCHRLLST